MMMEEEVHVQDSAFVLGASSYSAHGGVFSSAESTKVDVGDEHDKKEAGQLSISLFIFLPFYY